MKINRITSFLNHRRIILFWLVAGLGVAAPWLVTMGEGSIERRPDGNLQTCTVMNVYDGDTITVNCDGKRQKVRLYCIDAPEMGQRPWGKESRDYLREQLPRGAKVQISTHTRDRYGRAVAEIYSEGRNVNLSTIDSGTAAVYRKYCSEKGYFTAESTARTASLGIWGKTGDHQHPWDWRRHH